MLPPHGVDTIPVKDGDQVTVDYDLILEDGTVFDSTEKKGRPMEFRVGTGQLIRGFEQEIIGLEVGDEKEFKLQPSEAYGDYNKDMVEELPRDQFPDGIKPDLMVLMGLPNGTEIPAKVIKVTDDTVTIDLNHPLAGEILHFAVRLLNIS